MASTNEGDLAPDDVLLCQIFPQSKPAFTKILSQTREICTFIAHFDTGQSESSYEDVVVRLEGSKNQLHAISAVQQVGALAIPDLIPAVHRIGTAKTQDGKELDFSVTAFLADAVTLETVWDDLSDGQQSEMMDAVVSAMTKLQAINLGDAIVRNLLEAAGCAPLQEVKPEGSTAPHQIIGLGGPKMGFFEDIPGLLAGIIASHNKPSHEPTCTLKRDPGSNGIIVTSAYKELSEVHIPQEELASLQHRIVFCHNDLEPRNLLVRPVPSRAGPVRYELVAIIDWEMAGAFPFAYEYYMKDAFLGSSNLPCTWYTLFKQHTASLLSVTPLAQSEMLFMQALDLVYQSRYKRQRKNVGALFREKWIEREQLIPGPFLWSGWVRRSDAIAVKKYTKEDDELLEKEILKQLGYL